MSRFDPKKVNETWNKETLADGRKRFEGIVDGVSRKTWQSHLRGENCKGGEYPLRGRFVCPYQVNVIENDILVSSRLIYTTKRQFRILTKLQRDATKAAVFHDVLASVAKLMDKIEADLKKEFGSTSILDSILSAAFNTFADEYLNIEYITKKVKDLTDKDS